MPSESFSNDNRRPGHPLPVVTLELAAGKAGVRMHVLSRDVDVTFIGVEDVADDDFVVSPCVAPQDDRALSEGCASLEKVTASLRFRLRAENEAKQQDGPRRPQRGNCVSFSLAVATLDTLVSATPTLRAAPTDKPSAVSRVVFSLGGRPLRSRRIRSCRSALQHAELAPLSTD